MVCPALAESLLRAEEERAYKLLVLKDWTLLLQNYQEITGKELFREGALMVSLAMGSEAGKMRV